MSQISVLLSSEPCSSLSTFIALQVKAKDLTTAHKALYDIVLVFSQTLSYSTFSQFPNSRHTGLSVIPGTYQAWSCLRAFVLTLPSKWKLFPPLLTLRLYSNVSKTFSGSPVQNFPSSPQCFPISFFIFLHKNYSRLIYHSKYLLKY